DVFVTGIVTGIAYYRLAFPSQIKHDTFMGKPAQAGSLDRRTLRIERVDLHNPAEGIGFVAVVCGGVFSQTATIKTGKTLLMVIRRFVGKFPAIAAGLSGMAHTIATLFARHFISGSGTIAEITSPVLFSSKVC